MVALFSFIQWLICAVLCSLGSLLIGGIVVGFLPKAHPMYELFAAIVRRLV